MKNLVEKFLFKYQVKIADFFNFPIDNVKKISAITYIHYELTALTETRIKTEKTHHILQLSQSQLLNPYIEFNTQKRLKEKKN